MDPHFQMTYNGAANGQSELTAGSGNEQPTKEWWRRSAAGNAVAAVTRLR